LAADEALGSEIAVRKGERLADAELAIQLVQRWRAEPPAEVSPDIDTIGDVIACGGARARYGVAADRQRRDVVHRRANQARLEVVAVVIAPPVDARAQREGHPRHRHDEIL